LTTSNSALPTTKNTISARIPAHASRDVPRKTEHERPEERRKSAAHREEPVELRRPRLWDQRAVQRTADRLAAAQHQPDAGAQHPELHGAGDAPCHDDDARPDGETDEQRPLGTQPLGNPPEQKRSRYPDGLNQHQHTHQRGRVEPERFLGVRYRHHDHRLDAVIEHEEGKKVQGKVTEPCDAPERHPRGAEGVPDDPGAVCPLFPRSFPHPEHRRDTEQRPPEPDYQEAETNTPLLRRNSEPLRMRDHQQVDDEHRPAAKIARRETFAGYRVHFSGRCDVEQQRVQKGAAAHGADVCDAEER